MVISILFAVMRQTRTSSNFSSDMYYDSLPYEAELLRPLPKTFYLQGSAAVSLVVAD
jgi:hypothetical protein